MSLCNQCGGTLTAINTTLDVSATPALSGLVLACSACERPIGLIHKRRLSGHRTRRDRAEVNRALRAARRAKQRRA